MNRRVVYLSAILFVILVSSCTNEPAVQLDQLYGEWEIIAAKRNLKLTRTLKNGYFVFNEEGVMKTNIFGSDQVFEVQISSDKISQLDDAKTEYKIRTLQNDTLHITSTIQKHYFDFLAVKRDSLVL
jgi:hypothetical protein